MSGAEEGATMTFAEAFEELRRIAAERGGDARLTAGAWIYDDGTTRLEWEIWSAVDQCHYSGATVRVALDAYRAGPVRTDDALEAVGACEVAP